jgi:hypothetical protein
MPAFKKRDDFVVGHGQRLEFSGGRDGFCERQGRQLPSHDA